MQWKNTLFIWIYFLFIMLISRWICGKDDYLMVAALTLLVVMWGDIMDIKDKLK